MKLSEKKLIYNVISCQQKSLASKTMREAWCNQAGENPLFIRIIDNQFRASRSVMGPGMLWQRERTESQRILRMRQRLRELYSISRRPREDKSAREETPGLSKPKKKKKNRPQLNHRSQQNDLGQVRSHIFQGKIPVCT